VREGLGLHVSQHWAWLGGAFVVAFAVPFVFADVLEIERDLYYGIYAVAVVALFAAWSRATGYDLRRAVVRRWPWALGLGLAVGGLLAVMVLRTEDSTARPDGLELVGAVAWRGIVSGLVALIASLGMTAAYHAGYSDFRGEKMQKPLTGDVVWSIPTLVTLNPIGAPIAHASMHTTAVLHSYETDTFLPPH
jgi:hypothetical protein